MFGRKGQGALEYLLILAAVLVIAVIVILVAHRISTPAQTSVTVNQDKFDCAKVGIELLNYNELPQQASDVSVKYNDISDTCEQTTTEPDSYDASCKIHFKDNSEHYLYVNQPNTTSVECYIQVSA